MHTIPASNAGARRARGERRWLLAALSAASFAALPPVAAAQSPPPAPSSRNDDRVTFNIAPQPLSSALIEFARQSGASVLFPHDELEGLRANSVEGAFSRSEALQRLLDDTGYAAEIEATGEIRVRKTAPDGAPHAQQRSDAPDAGPSRVESNENPTPHATAEADEIVVTGSRIRGAHPAGANLFIVDREEIAESGRSTVQDVLAQLPQNFVGQQNELTQINSTALGRNLTFGSSVNLRGLGADATLTLVNGRRLAPAGQGDFVDISAIPLAAVERIEVLADGASATYGSDAVGGVVNVILRSDFDGAETNLRYGAATQGGPDEAGFAQVLGRAWESGYVVGAYEFRERGSLAAADRAFTADSDLTPFGGTNFSSTTANPGNIVRIGTTPASLAIPQGQDGTQLTEADLISGQLNFQNGNEGGWLLPEQQSHSVFASARQEFGERFEAFFDMLASQRRAHMEDTQLGATLVVPETNAYRQLNGLFPGAGPITITYFMGDDLGPLSYDTEAQTISALAGAALKLPRDWRIETAISFGAHVDDVDLANAFDSSGALASALASSERETAFNPFGDGSHTSLQALEGLTRRIRTTSESDLWTFSMKADGALLTLPAGEMRAASTRSSSTRSNSAHPPPS